MLFQSTFAYLFFAQDEWCITPPLQMTFVLAHSPYMTCYQSPNKYPLSGTHAGVSLFHVHKCTLFSF